MKKRFCPKIQLCTQCGQMKGLHGQTGCKVSHEIIRTLASFKAANGARWKSKLRDLWMSGTNSDENLQQARNLIGPSRLDKIRI